MIIDFHTDKWKTLDDADLPEILTQARHLYGLLHSRYIMLPEGMDQIKQKYIDGLYGKCPRYNCNGEHLLPVGLNQKLQKNHVKLFCPQCYDVYRAPKHIKIDGAHFGSSFPHLFITYNANYDRYREFKPTILYMFGVKLHRSMLPRCLPHKKNIHYREILDFDYYIK